MALPSRVQTAALCGVVGLYLTFPIALGLANALMLLILLVWLVGLACGNVLQHWQALRRHPVAWSALGLYGVVVVGGIHSPAPWQDYALHLDKYAKLVFCVVLLSLLLTSPRWQQRAMQGFIVAMGFILASTWLNVWFLLPWSATQQTGWGITHHVFGDYITQNVMMAFFVLLAAVRAAHADRRGAQLAWGMTALLASVSITHLSVGRTGYVLLGTALAVFALTRRHKHAGWLGLMLTACLLAAAWFTSDTMQARFNLVLTEAQHSTTDTTSSIGHRLYNYKTTPRLIAEKPWLGWGTGSYHTTICHVLDEPDACVEYAWHPHNQYLFFTAEHGVVGLLAYLALLGSMAWLAKQSTHTPTRTLLYGLTALLAVDSLFNSPLFSARENHFFMYMLALLASMARTPARPVRASTSSAT